MAHRSGPARVVVVGAGLTGLTAAWLLRDSGVEVVLLEAGDRIGGQIHTVPFAGMPVDMGAEAVHLAAPGAAQLLEQLQLADSVVASGPGGTLIGDGRRLIRLPEGMGPAGPTRLWPLARSRALGPLGMARAAWEPVAARGQKRSGAVGDDVSVRDFVVARFGAQVADRLIDPLVGGLHSGDISRLSLQSATPLLAVFARSGRSIVLSGKARRAAAGGSPSGSGGFVTWVEGLITLPETMLAQSGATVRFGARVTRVLAAAGGGYAVQLAPAIGAAPRQLGEPAGPVAGRDPAVRTACDAALPGEQLTADAVVLAVPASVAAPILEQLCPAGADPLARQRFASVATVAAAFPVAVKDRVPALRGTGILLSSTSARVLKAATFFGTKWPHLAAPDVYVLRMSAGRDGVPVAETLDDDELVSAVLGDLGELIGLREKPIQTRVQRWRATMPQLEVGHARRLAAARGALAAYPGVVVAGASYDGVGIAACVRSARTAVDGVLAVLAEPGAASSAG